MSNYGRRPVPGEKGVQGVLDQRNVLNRVLRAQVSAVNPENGFVVINYENMPSGGKYVTVPPLWMSFPDSATNSGPAWGRYMPQQSDLVKVGFGYDDKPHILGFDIVAGKANVGDGEAGWPQLNDQYQAGKSSSDAQRAKFAQFTPLNPGEFDFMSSGGAYIYGNNRGKLYLAGGSVSISLIKNDLRISQRAQLWTHIADDSEFRLGQVRRTDPADQLEKAVGAGTEKEFNVTLKTTTAPGSSLALSTLKMGNVLNDVGVAEKTSAAGQDLRWSYQAFNDAGVQVLQEMVDKVGNWEVSAPLATKGVNFDFSAGEWTTKFASAKHAATQLFQLDTTTAILNANASFTVNSPKISLGGTGSELNPLILTSIYQVAETTFATGIAAQVTALATTVATLAAGLSALGVVLTAAGAVMTIPIAGAIIAGPGIGAGGAAATAVGGAAAGAAGGIAGSTPAVATAFTGPYATYLSKVSSTK